MHCSDFFCFFFGLFLACISYTVIILSKRFDGSIPMPYETSCVNSRAQEFWASCCFWNCIDLIFLYKESNLVFFGDHFFGVYTDESLSTLFCFVPGFLSCKGNPFGLMDQSHWFLCFPPQNTWKSSSTFRGISAVSVSFLKDSQGLGS